VQLRPRNQPVIEQLLQKGISIPNPWSIDLDDGVNPAHISATGVVIHPGCRIAGGKTVISAGCELGAEGPVTLIDCQLGQDVRLKGGYFHKAVFLDGSSMGSGAHVREACILEEQASGAHCVGLKQTILFPFVTLGSLINFCDCLMSGGTSRKHHSEVGSSYIHFNFTPEGDKTTASLIGDVPRGVMLDQPPIFLGGQGGLVGPLRLGFGNVVAAGCILRQDIPEDGKLVFGQHHRATVCDFKPGRYLNLNQIVVNNLHFLANLVALKAWYRTVRRAFFDEREFGPLIYAGAQDNLEMALVERTRRLRAMAVKVPLPPEGNSGPDARLRRALHEQVDQICALFTSGEPDLENAEVARDRALFLQAIERQRDTRRAGYIETIQALPAEQKAIGTRWLGKLVRHLIERAGILLEMRD
jgi:bifunctional UDP-N-acetylglucosamine pyrophosphorylase/glucosamine-1-phosphate N-acetyltransferase